MLFNDLGFLPFLAATVVAARLTHERGRWITILVASLLFYASFRSPALLGVLALEAGVAWAGGLAIVSAGDHGARWRRLLAALVLLVGALVATRLALHAGGTLVVRIGLASAVGVSYFTLQAISYLVDVYMERLDAEPNPGRLAGYLAFFPRLVQGPIERAPFLLSQLRSPATPGYEELRSAALLFAGGLFKKVVLADRLAPVVDAVYAHPDRFGGLVPVLATYAFAFQLYFDFSGYTDMARGSARALGVELSENFRSPYLATSVTEFWRRWHITFSRWLLDYVFTSLQVAWRRRRVAGVAAALFATFALSGLWHGFTGPFLVWGMLHGTYLATEAVWRSRRGRRFEPPGRGLRILRAAATFHVVALAWVFFRAPSLDMAGQVLTSVLTPTRGLDLLVGGVGLQALAVTLVACLGYGVVAVAWPRPSLQAALRVAPVRWAWYLALVAAILLLRQDALTYLYAQF